MPVCVKAKPINRFAELEVVVAAVALPIPTSKFSAVPTAAFTFCFILKDTKPLVRGARVPVFGEKPNITCDPFAVVFLK